jgi:hypothetical protein
MNHASLRIDATEELLDEIENDFSGYQTSRYKKGQNFAFGKGSHSESSISVVLVDGNSTNELVLEVNRFLAEIRTEAGARLKAATNSILRIGFTVGDSEQFTVTADFSPENLALMGTFGIALEFSAYPTSDTANTK